MRSTFEIARKVIELSEFGRTFPDVISEWQPLKDPNPKEQAEINKTKADTDAVLSQAGAIDAGDIRRRLSQDETGDYANIDPDDLPEKEDNDFPGGAADEEENWVTIKGSKVLIGKGGEIKAGMGGKFAGQKISEIGKNTEQEQKPTQQQSTQQQTATTPQTQGNTGTKTFTSKDLYVGEIATAIEAEFPGRVKAVNKEIVDPQTGRVLTEIDIVLDNTVIQVKSGSAPSLVGQMQNTKKYMGTTVIGYAPDLKPRSPLIRDAQKKGFRVFTSEGALLTYLKKNQP